MKKSTKIPPYRFIDLQEITSLFKNIRACVIPWIKRQYKHREISRKVAIDREQLLLLSERLMLSIYNARMDPGMVIRWIDAIGEGDEDQIENINKEFLKTIPENDLQPADQLQ